MKINRLIGFINSTLADTLPEHVKMPSGVQPEIAFTSHLSPQGQIIACTLDGREYYIEQNTPCLFPGFKPENEGTQSFIKGLPFPEEYHVAALIIPASPDPKSKKLFAVFHVSICLNHMQMWYNRTLIRHSRDGKCVWAGFESSKTPNPGPDTIVEKRLSGENCWVRVTSTTKDPFGPLDSFKAPAEKKSEEWSPSKESEAEVTSDGIISIESGKKPQEKPQGRVTPKAPRSQKKKAAEG